MHKPCFKSVMCLPAAFATSASLNAASIANGNFGRQQSWKVDAAVYAQPLFAPGTVLAPCNGYLPWHRSRMYVLQQILPGC